MSLHVLTVGKELPIGGDWWSHVTVDHRIVSVILLRSPWVQMILAWDGFLDDNGRGWCWWVVGSAEHLLVLEELIHKDRYTGGVWSCVLAVEHLRGPVKLLRESNHGTLHLVLELIVMLIVTLEDSTREG